MNQSKLEVIWCSWCKTWENACERVTIGFGWTCDWMKKWRESFKPIVWRRKCKTNFFSTLERKPLYDLNRTNHQAITSTEQTQTGLTNNTCACMKIIEKLTVDIVHQALLLSYKWLIHDLNKPNVDFKQNNHKLNY